LQLGRWPRRRPRRWLRPLRRGPQWVHEIKLDGYRMAARIDNGRVQLLTRTGLDWAGKYPSAVAAQARFRGRRLQDDRRAYAPGNRGLWRKAKTLNRQEFVVVGWSDPEGTRPHLGALLLGYYTDDGKLIYPGRVGTGMPRRGACRTAATAGPASPENVVSKRPPAEHNPVRIAAHSISCSLGRAEAGCGDHLSDLDGRRPVAPHGLCRPQRRQAGGAGAAGSRRRLSESGQGSISQRRPVSTDIVL
jgi:hypothetical protein